MLQKTKIKFGIKLLVIALAFYLIDYPFIISRVDDYLVREDFLKLFSYLLQVVLFILLIAFFSISKNIVRYIFLILFLINSIGYLTYFYATTIPLVFSDFIILFDAQAEISNAFRAYSSAFFKSVLMHIPFFIAFLLYPSVSLKWKGTTITVTCYVVIISIFMNTLIKTEGRGLIGKPGFVIPTVQGLVYTFVSLEAKYKNYKIETVPRSDYELFAVQDKGIKTLVMVIDESVNWDMIDLTSNLGVTPSLKEYPKENIINFEKSLAYANCSDVSNASIRKFVRYQEEEADLLQSNNVYLWTIARNAGFTPYLLDLQRDGFNHNYFTSEEINSINVIPVKGMRDHEVVDVIEELIGDHPDEEKKFILVIKEGAHFPYEAIDQPIFTPDMPTSSMKSSSTEEIFNSYKNRVYYQTNIFFEKIFEKLPFREDLAVVYTSDHGQSFEKLATLKTHCNSKNPELTEAVVPLLIIAPEQNKYTGVVDKIQASAKVKSHYLIPAILMGYMGYSEQDIASFTEYERALDVNQPNYFVYSKAIPFFTDKALKLEVSDQEIEELSHQKID